MKKELKKLKKKYKLLHPILNERDRRLSAAADAMILGFGGITLVHKATGIARTTITTGIHELKTQPATDMGRVRRTGGGRKPLSSQQKDLAETLKKIANPSGNPESPFLHTGSSIADLTEEMHKRHFSISSMSVYRTLKQQGFALKANKKNIEGGNHPDRNTQFEYIEKKSSEMQLLNVPILSCDCKKRELIGNFKNNGRQWQPKGSEQQVNVYDFESQAKGHAYPYGILDIIHNMGFVNIGIDHNTALFAVESIRRWYIRFGERLYPNAKELFLLVDGGNPNSSVSRLWKLQLQRLANETGIIISVSHYPPGTSKWNAIEHALFSFISINWRAKPLVSYEFMLELLNATATKSGLTVTAIKDDHLYETGIKISAEEFSRLNILEDKFHGDWNYTIIPQKSVFLQA